MRLTNAITVGPFTLDAPIRSGGMGTIWGGVHTDSGEQVAVKVLTWSRAREPEFVEAFEHEARAIAALDHPAIVRIYDYGVLDDAADRASAGALASGSPYLVMPLADGSLDTEGHIGDWPALKQLLEALLEALAHAHARGVVHRDIKPANVLLSGDRIILSDFGLAHPMVPTNEGPLPAAVGTPWYMAPEQFTGEWREFGPWTDLYALGILGWRFACGERPYQGDSVAQLAEQHMKEVLPALRPCFALPDGFDAWLQRLTTKEPEDRFQRAADAAVALARLGEPSLHNVLPSGIWRPLVSSEPDSWADTMVDPTSPVAARLDGRVDPKHPTRIEAPSIPASWRLESDQAGHGLLQGAGLGLFALRSLPLVGRDSERDVLWGHLSDVLSQRTPTVVCLRGAAGTGKSRLADWLQTRAHELGVADTFRAVHAPLAGPGDGLGGMVARQLGCVGLERGPLTERLEARVRRQGTTNPHEWRGLAELMQPSGLRDTGRFKFRNPVERFVLLERHIQRGCAGGRAAVIWLDDAQWSLDSLAFAAHLLGVTPGASGTRDMSQAPERSGLPALVILTIRDDALAERPPARELLSAITAHERSATIDVGPLGQEHRRALVETMLGLRGELAARVESRCGGNPQFAVQLVDDWVRRGLLVPGASGFRLAPGAEVDLPSSLHEVWSRRIERVLAALPESDHVAFELAAALGVEPSTAEWVAACRAAGIAPSAALVPALAREHLVMHSQPGTAFTFAHNMLRESLLLRAENAGRLEVLHETCARVLDPHKPNADERIGRHLVAAGLLLEALEPLAGGIRRLLDTGDNRNASVLLEERDGALLRSTLAPGDARHADGHLLRARLHRMRGEFERAEREADLLIEVAADHGWARAVAEGLIERGRVHWTRGQAEPAARCLSRAESAASKLGDQRLVADSVRLQGLVDLTRGQFDRASRSFERALAMYQDIKDPVWVAASWMNRGIADRLAGRLDESGLKVHRALEAFSAAECLWGEAECLNELGEAARARGDLEAAEDLYRQAMERNTSLGSGDLVFNQINLGLVLSQRGRWQQALEALTRGLETYSEQGRQGFVGVTYGLLLPVIAALGHWAEWDTYLGRAGTILESTGFVDVDAAAEVQRAAEYAASAGQAERALAAFGLAVRQWRALDREDEAAAVTTRMRAIRSGR